MNLREGEFVTIKGLNLGLGKLVALSSTVADVSYFASPARGETHREQVDPACLDPAILTAQTRVYWFDKGSQGWVVGRVAENARVDRHMVGAAEDLYNIDLPNRQMARIPVSALRVRWSRPVEDPVAYLAARTTETPFWHAGRRKLFRHLVAQRAQCSSVTGLWSAAVHLSLHQAKTVRTVLTDPVQRYLLADEVGLGKTIEAGAILRQYVLDEPDKHQALVLVPPHLVEQWKGELQDRFYLRDHLGKSVHVVSSAGRFFEHPAAQGLGMLIVDEAHQLASVAFSPDAGVQRLYQELAMLAQRAPRLLLLSATPVLRNEDGFLAMLHLLEPRAYPLQDREGFRRRVANRQQIAESLSDLQPDAGSFFLEDAIDRLGPLTQGDDQAARLIAHVRRLMDADEHDAERQDAIRKLRDHVAEVYRLHRRLIRHRRETVDDVLHGRDGAEVLQTEDPVRRRLAELLEQWRDQVHLEADRDDGSIVTAAALYWLFLQASCSHPMVLREIINARRHRRAPLLALAPNDTNLGLLHAPDLFAGENDLLDAILDISGTEGFSRRSSVIDTIERGRKRRAKTVVFADAPGVADALAKSLEKDLGQAVLRHSPGLDLAPFLATNGPAIVLVCDRHAEEGLNLQAARAQVLHLDLPLSPGRLEQRLGRIDRYGARSKARSMVFADPDPIAETWRRCAQEVIRVFDRSIASLQYVLDEQIRWLQNAAFNTGVEAVEELAERLADAEDGLEAELKRIRMQEQLDAMNEPSAADKEWFLGIDEFDADDEIFKEGLESWALNRLQFVRVAEGEAEGLARYRYESFHGRRTLVSVDDFIKYYRRSLDVAAGRHSRDTHCLGFDRYKALKGRAQVARLGHPFVDGLAEHARQDDRGVAYIMWRCRPGVTLPEDPWLVFGFDFLIEADVEASMPALAGMDRAQLNHAALRRRLDEILPPHYATVWLDHELEPIEEPALLELLVAEYSNKWSGGARDWNVSTSRWDTARLHLQVGAWDELCTAAAVRALKLMKERIGLDAKVAAAEARIDERLERVRNQFDARVSRLRPDDIISERTALDLEETLAAGARRAVSAPRVIPDSAFATILATWHPFGTETE